LAQKGILRRSGKIWHKDRAKYLLSNPFYYGHFRYAKEVYEGKHEPIITKKLFDKVQEILKQRGRPRHKSVIEPQVFCGLLKCGTCGMMITGEYRVKKTEKWKCSRLHLLPLHQEKQNNQMSRTLYSPRKFRRTTFLPDSKSFFASGLGGKTFKNVRK